MSGISLKKTAHPFRTIKGTVCFFSLLSFFMDGFSKADPPESDAWKRALELVGAFSNDGFRIRDGHWIARMDSGSGSKVLETNLYSGNAYWFCAASGNAQSAVKLSVHDASGVVLVPESALDAGRSAVAFSPEISGPYYLRVQVASRPGQAASADSFCVVYAYK